MVLMGQVGCSDLRGARCTVFYPPDDSKGRPTILLQPHGEGDFIQQLRCGSAAETLVWFHALMATINADDPDWQLQAPPWHDRDTMVVVVVVMRLLPHSV